MQSVSHLNSPDVHEQLVLLSLLAAGVCFCHTGWSAASDALRKV